VALLPHRTFAAHRHLLDRVRTWACQLSRRDLHSPGLISCARCVTFSPFVASGTWRAWRRPPPACTTSPLGHVDLRRFSYGQRLLVLCHHCAQMVADHPPARAPAVAASPRHHHFLLSSSYPGRDRRLTSQQLAFPRCPPVHEHAGSQARTSEYK